MLIGGATGYVWVVPLSIWHICGAIWTEVLLEVGAAVWLEAMLHLLRALHAMGHHGRRVNPCPNSV